LNASILARAAVSRRLLPERSVSSSSRAFTRYAVFSRGWVPGDEGAQC
jgi:hypothetical protein